MEVLWMFIKTLPCDKKALLIVSLIVIVFAPSIGKGCTTQGNISSDIQLMLCAFVVVGYGIIYPLLKRVRQGKNPLVDPYDCMYINVVCFVYGWLIYFIIEPRYIEYFGFDNNYLMIMLLFWVLGSLLSLTYSIVWLGSKKKIKQSDVKVIFSLGVAIMIATNIITLCTTGLVAIMNVISLFSESTGG
jgi:hypothetical protein